MLLVHGMQDHCRTWDDLVQDFHQDFHVVAPDLRGHGDSEWVKGASYTYQDYMYDLHQLVTQTEIGPVTLVGHSLGGAVAALFAGAFPELVARLVVIEGIGLWRKFQPDVNAIERLREWVINTRQLSARQPRRYQSLEEAYQRMQTANPNLKEEQALHLTIHGSNQNEDGSYSWKYDNYTHNFSPAGLAEEDVIAHWQNVSCPTLILTADSGLEHRIGHDGTEAYFQQAQCHEITDAEHWTYHDQKDVVVGLMREFIAATPVA